MKTKRMIKKSLLILLCITMISSITLPIMADTSTLTDIAGNPREEILQEWFDKGYIKGNPDGTFKPDNPINRAEFMALVNRAFELTEAAVPNFSDVSESDWFYADVAKAVKAGYMQGYTEKIYPRRILSRQEFAIALTRLGNLDTEINETVLNALSDKEAIPAWSKGAISAVLSINLFEDFVTTEFNPTQNVSRVEAVVVLDRLISYLESIAVPEEVVPEGAPTPPPSSGGNDDDDDEPTVLPDIVIRSVSVTSATTISFTSNVDEASILWNGVALSIKTLNGANSITVPVMVSGENNSLFVKKSGYKRFTKNDIVFVAGAAIEDGTKVYGATVTDWYDGGSRDLLDTSVNFNFDNLPIESIASVKFTLYDGDTVLGTRLSKGANLVTLLKDCAQYWGATADSYLSVKGARTMSSAFSYREEESDNGYWVSSASTIMKPQLPTKILVEVQAGDTVYKAVTEYPTIEIIDTEKVYGANVTSWYDGGSRDLLDTSVNFNFNNLPIGSIASVKFTLYDGDTVLGTRLSKGANLVTLLKDCAQYWGATADSYLNVEGARTMSSAFSYREAESDNGYWVSSASTIMKPQLPTKILVEVLAGHTLYKAVTEYPLKDMTAYNAALAAVTRTDYTEASWTAYQLIVAANAVCVNWTQEQVDAATAAITAAQASLVVIPGNIFTVYPSRVYELDGSNNTSGVVGYGVVVGFMDFTLGDVQTLKISLYDVSNNLLQTNKLISELSTAYPSLDMISTSFDVSGTFNYVVDGNWEVNPSMFGSISVPAYALVEITLTSGRTISTKILK